MWSLWKRRNLKLWQQQNETCLQVVERARHLFVMLMLARLLDFTQHYNGGLVFIMTMLILFWIPSPLLNVLIQT